MIRNPTYIGASEDGIWVFLLSEIAQMHTKRSIVAKIYKQK